MGEGAGYVTKLKLSDRVKRLELIGKHIDVQAFREQLEMDSMDFLDIVMELRKRYRVQVPEEDYGALASMSSTVEYLTPKLEDTEKV